LTEFRWWKRNTIHHGEHREHGDFFVGSGFIPDRFLCRDKACFVSEVGVKKIPFTTEEIKALCVIPRLDRGIQ
jgi:hypothetical protein